MKRITSGIAFVSVIAGSLYMAYRFNTQPEVVTKVNSSTTDQKNLQNSSEPPATDPTLSSESSELQANNLSDESAANTQATQLTHISPLNIHNSQHPAGIERTPEQTEQLTKELELWEIMMSSEYASYSSETLMLLAEQNDPVAFHQLIVRGEISVDDMQRLAKHIGKQGYPMTYGFAADGIFGSTNDKILAMAYYMAAVNHGSELMRQFELDYKVWFRLEEEEVALAAELAKEL